MKTPQSPIAKSRQTQHQKITGSHPNLTGEEVGLPTDVEGRWEKLHRDVNRASTAIYEEIREFTGEAKREMEEQARVEQARTNDWRRERLAARARGSSESIAEGAPLGPEENGDIIFADTAAEATAQAKRRNSRSVL